MRERGTNYSHGTECEWLKDVYYTLGRKVISGGDKKYTSGVVVLKTRYVPLVYA
jgi:hypothetical protein